MRIGGPRAHARHVEVAPSIVNNNPETMERSRRSFPTAAGWFFPVASFGQNAPADAVRLSCPRPLRARAQGCARDLEWVRGSQQRTPHPSWPVATSSCPLPQPKSDSSDFGRLQSARTRASPSSSGRGRNNGNRVCVHIPISRCQTALLVPAAHFCARGLQLCFTHPESRGGRSAERRSGACEAPVGHAVARQRRA